MPVFTIEDFYPLILRLMYFKLHVVTFEKTLHFVENLVQNEKHPLLILNLPTLLKYGRVFVIGLRLTRSG
jgi:hypothetical protein